jgi:hypothetical protein
MTVAAAPPYVLTSEPPAECGSFEIGRWQLATSLLRSRHDFSYRAADALTAYIVQGGAS